MKEHRFPRGLIVLPYAAAVLAAWFGYRQLGPLPSGIPLNRLAWERAFLERGLPLPPNGPREGYWGKAKPLASADPELGWREVAFRLPGRVDTDALGFQSAGEPGAARQILILGGSVAWGAYASSFGATYFSLLAERLARDRYPARISVLATAAWDSENEIAALGGPGLARRPDLVVFLNGLNDVTDSGLLRRGKSVPRAERVGRYLRNMESGRQMAAERRVPAVFCLQPFLLQKRQPSRIEKRIVELSFKDDYPQEFVRSAYPLVREGLRRVAGPQGAYFIDCSGAFDAETATTFADIWHFPDPGHRLLAECLARELEPILAHRGGGS